MTLAFIGLKKAIKMRLYTESFDHLDPKGKLGLWKEAIQCQSTLVRVLKGQRKVGYSNHPQVWRMLSYTNPIEAVGLFLSSVWDANKESEHHYNLNYSLILHPSKDWVGRLKETAGQLQCEHLIVLEKLANRVGKGSKLWQRVMDDGPKANPVFQIIPGPARLERGLERVRI